MAEESLSVLEEDPEPNKWVNAVLPAEAIKYYSASVEHPLIFPFEYDNLGAARYDLRLGDEANVGGKRQKLDEKHPLILAPHQMAVVKTYEYLRIPRFVIARWNLKVRMVYEGLLWVGGPQVDPGWAGYLYCPIYNLAERDVIVNFKDQVFTMDFVKVPPTILEDKRFKPQRRTLSDHDKHQLRSAPYEELHKVQELQTAIYGGIALVIAILAVVIGVIGAIIAAPLLDNNTKLNNVWWPLTLTAFALGLFSFALSVFILLKGWIRIR